MQNQRIDFRGTRILYLALLIGQVLIGLTIFYMAVSLSSGEPTLDMSFGDIKQLFIILFAPAMIMISHYVYSKRIREGKKLSGYGEKIMHFRESSILRWALLEGVNLINLIFFSISENYFFLLVFAFGFIFFLFARPSEDGFIEDYKLNYEEKQAFKEELKNASKKN